MAFESNTLGFVQVGLASAAFVVFDLGAGDVVHAANMDAVVPEAAFCPRLLVEHDSAIAQLDPVGVALRHSTDPFGFPSNSF